MNQQYKSFMGQFAAAKKDVAELRAVMKDSARVATLSYPAPPASPPMVAPKPVPPKRKP